MDIKTFKATKFPRGTRFEFRATTKYGPVAFVNATRTSILRMAKTYTVDVQIEVFTAFELLSCAAR